nr:hypothetical protein [Armatimonas sp.]
MAFISKAVIKSSMSLTELRPALHALPRQEKFMLVQELLAELAQHEDLTKAGLVLENAYHLWTPSENHEAAASLLKLLEKDKAGKV